MLESKLQTKIIKWLRENDVYVIKTTPGGGTPVGCPDIIGLYRDRWLSIEVKAREKARVQPLQAITLNRLRSGNEWVFRVYPENWELVKQNLQENFF